MLGRNGFTTSRSKLLWHAGCLAFVVVAGTVHAQGDPIVEPVESGWGDDSDDDAGFSDGDDDTGFGDRKAQELAHQTSPGELSATGSVREQAGLWLQRLGDTPLAQARTSMDGQVRYKKRYRPFGQQVTLRLMASGHAERDLAYLVDREAYDEATLDAYEGQLIGGETFLSLSHGALELTLGRQIVNLGRGDLISPLDVVNPRDLREPGLAELQDIRLAVLASRLGVFAGYHRLELMVVHEAYFGLRPAPLSLFSPFRETLRDAPLLPSNIRYLDVPKRFAADNQQFVLRYGYAGPGGDVALIAASVLDQQVIVDGSAILAGLPNPLALFAAPLESLVIPLRHPRYEMFGASAALPVSELVVRAELGLDLGRSFMNTGGTQSAVTATTGLPNVARGEQLNWMLGVVYSGIEDGTITLEYAGRHLFSAPQGFARPAMPDLGLLYRQDFLRQRLHITAAGTVFGLLDQEFQGVLGRLECDYDVSDGLSAGLGYITYLPHDTDRLAVLSGYRRNDRLFLNLRFHFLLD